MALDITKSVEIIELMENYISFIRPEPEIRKQLDINYEINDQSVILIRIRPFWDNPDKLMTLGYAKATYVQSKHVCNYFGNGQIINGILTNPNQPLMNWKTL